MYYQIIGNSMLTLDDLEKELPVTSHQQHQGTGSWKLEAGSNKKGNKVAFGFREVIKVGIVVFSSFLVGNIVTNAGLYGEKIYELRNGMQQVSVSEGNQSARFAKSTKQDYLNLLFKTQTTDKKQNVKDDIYGYYKERPEKLDFQFNTLPPDNYIIIEDLGVQAPIVTVEGDIAAKKKEGAFTEELKQGTIWYPGTPGIDELGTTMIAGHTSNFFWVKSAYNTVFRKIPELKPGQVIKIIWEGKMYEYITTEQTIVKPEEVSKTYANNYDSKKKMIALMGCFPVGTRDKRIIQFAVPKPKPYEQPSANTLAYHANEEGRTQN